jgi:hypothetical protein
MANSGLYTKYLKMNKEQNLNPADLKNLDITKSKLMRGQLEELEALKKDWGNTDTPEEKTKILAKIQKLFAQIRDLAKKNAACLEARSLYMKAEAVLCAVGLDPLKFETLMKEQKKAIEESQASQGQQES